MRFNMGMMMLTGRKAAHERGFENHIDCLEHDITYDSDHPRYVNSFLSDRREARGVRWLAEDNGSGLWLVACGLWLVTSGW
jgi:hypothetical protein